MGDFVLEGLLLAVAFALAFFGFVSASPESPFFFLPRCRNLSSMVGVPPTRSARDRFRDLLSSSPFVRARSDFS